MSILTPSSSNGMQERKAYCIKKIAGLVYIPYSFSLHYVAMHNSVITVSEPGRMSANSY
jgi:hypothetical protein